MKLVDNHNRRINYLRLSVTDRCNFRCTYCMPEHGVKFERLPNLLSIDELIRTTRLFSELGVDKVRITGGEPLVREGILDYLKEISTFEGIQNISITTNGSTIHQYIPALKPTKVKSVNVSLDSLDKHRFQQITRRDNYEQVISNLQHLVAEGFEVKVNCVVMDGVNIDDIHPFVEFTRDHNVSVRFLEEMPFNGSDKSFSGVKWNHLKILAHITSEYPQAIKLPIPESSTSSNYKIPGFKGEIGIIPSYSRTFCGTCNRVRVSHDGRVRTCLYGGPVFNVKDSLRSGFTDEEVKGQIIQAISKRAKDGFIAEEEYQQKESMTKIGG